MKLDLKVQKISVENFKKYKVNKNSYTQQRKIPVILRV
jgi:hypothetical protein